MIRAALSWLTKYPPEDDRSAIRAAVVCVGAVVGGAIVTHLAKLAGVL